MSNTKTKNVVKAVTTNKNADIKNAIKELDAKQIVKVDNKLYNTLNNVQQWRVYENKLLINLTKSDKTIKQSLLDVITSIQDSNKIDTTNVHKIKIDSEHLEQVNKALTTLYADLKITFNVSYNALKVAFMASVNGRSKVTQRGIKETTNNGNATLSPFVLALQQRVFGLVTKPLGVKPPTQPRVSRAVVTN